MTLPEMPCQEIVEVITEYLEGTLPEPDRTRFEEHLRGCPPCTTYLTQMRSSLAALRALDDHHMPAPQKTELLALFRDWRKARPEA